MKVFITGGGGFIGSHAAEFYARRGEEVVIFDNLSRFKILGRSQTPYRYNVAYLKPYRQVTYVEGDIQDLDLLMEHLHDSDIVIHAAAQTAVTASYQDPTADFAINARGTLNVLEAVRRQSNPPIVIYCSTNKVYGNKVERIPVMANQTRYEFAGKKFRQGINETFGVDLCTHSPYGCSKLSGDLYMQDYARHYDLKIGVFRQSCIYGTRQFGIEDQGWLAWFAIATHLGQPVTIYGDGKQVRDVLFIADLIAAFDAFVQKQKTPLDTVFNIGGGPENTLSPLELLEFLEDLTGKRSQIRYADWRPNDQKVYISDIRKAKESLGWSPRVSIDQGIPELLRWIRDNKKLFSEV